MPNLLENYILTSSQLISRGSLSASFNRKLYGKSVVR